MNLLQLVNRSRRECTDKGSDLTTVQGSLALENQRFKDWVQESWDELRMSNPHWRWLRATAQFDTTALINGISLSAAGAPTCTDWDKGTFRAWRKSVGASDEQILPFMEYETWRNVYQFGAMRTQSSRPVAVTVKPDNSLGIGPLPDDVYTVVGDYWGTGAALTLDADSPTDSGLPERFHMLLVYGAMEKFAHHEAAPEVYQRAARSQKTLKNQLFAWGLPVMTSGPSLA